LKPFSAVPCNNTSAEFLAQVWNGGFDGTNAQAALDTGLVDLIAFGRPFIANPDLVVRLKNGWPLGRGPSFSVLHAQRRARVH
jgi:2,4-dienoyl-CoA reductase-like NADH-dependent reductase (Old Yellow Enzyme family)